MVLNSLRFVVHYSFMFLFRTDRRILTAGIGHIIITIRACMYHSRLNLGIHRGNCSQGRSQYSVSCRRLGWTESSRSWWSRIIWWSRLRARDNWWQLECCKLRIDNCLGPQCTPTSTLSIIISAHYTAPHFARRLRVPRRTRRSAWCTGLSQLYHGSPDCTWRAWLLWCRPVSTNRCNPFWFVFLFC